MANREAGRLFSPSLKALILILGILGQVFSLNGRSFASGSHMLYYTNISNVLVTLLAATLLALDLPMLRKGKPLALPGWLGNIRFALTAGILLTFAVFSLLLIPRMSLSYLSSPSNLLVHNLVPLLACLDFILFSHGLEGKRQSPLPGLALPWLYFVFVMALMLAGTRFSGGTAPYFFLDYHANGWFTAGGGKLGVSWWLLILGALTILLSRILLGLQNLAARRIPDGK